MDVNGNDVLGLVRALAESPTNDVQREERRAAFNRLAAEDLAAIDRLTLEYQVLSAGNPLTGERIRNAIFRLADTYDYQQVNLPRGYRVLGGTAKTPRYIVRQDGGRATEADLVADALSGWLEEIARVQATRILNKRRQIGLDKEPVVLSADVPGSEETA